MALTVEMLLKIALNHTSVLDLGTAKFPATLDFGDSLASGTGADQADQLFTDTRTLTATSENLDLAGGLTDAFGATITFARIKGIAIRNKSTTDVLLVGGAASNAFVNWVANSSDIVRLRPGGVLVLWAPDATAYAVTAGTGDILKIDSGAATISYDIAIIGASA